MAHERLCHRPSAIDLKRGLEHGLRVVIAAVKKISHPIPKHEGAVAPALE